MCISHSSLKKVLFATPRGYYRDSQLVKMWRISDLGLPKLLKLIYLQCIPISKTQEKIMQEGAERLYEPIDQGAFC